MTDHKELINLILEYEGYVSKGNKILQSHFELSDSPLLARRRGEIPTKGKIESENMAFSFHGMGCRFEFGEVVVDFDYSFGDFIYKGFEASKLFCFIESCLPDGTSMTSEYVSESIRQLELDGLLVGKDESSYDTHEYTLSMQVRRH